MSLVCVVDAGTENVVASQLNGVDSDRHGFGDVTSVLYGEQANISKDTKYNTSVATINQNLKTTPLGKHRAQGKSCLHRESVSGTAFL